MVMNEAASGRRLLPTAAAPSVPITVAGTLLRNRENARVAARHADQQAEDDTADIIMPAPCTAKGSIGPLDTMARARCSE